MNEADYKRRLGAKAKDAGIKSIRFEDRFRAGIPDTLFYGNKLQVWMEAKIVEKPAHLSTPEHWKSYKLQQALFAKELYMGTPGVVLFMAYCPLIKASIAATPQELIECHQNQKPLSSFNLLKGYGFEAVEEAFLAQRSVTGHGLPSKVFSTYREIAVCAAS